MLGAANTMVSKSTRELCSLGAYSLVGEIHIATYSLKQSYNCTCDCCYEWEAYGVMLTNAKGC